MRTFDLRVMKDRRHLTSALLQHDDHALAISRWLHTYSLLVHQTIEAERVPGLQVVGLLSQKKKIQDNLTGQLVLIQLWFATSKDRQIHIYPRVKTSTIISCQLLGVH